MQSKQESESAQNSLPQSLMPTLATEALTDGYRAFMTGGKPALAAVMRNRQQKFQESPQQSDEDENLIRKLSQAKSPGEEDRIMAEFNAQESNLQMERPPKVAGSKLDPIFIYEKE